MGDVQLRFVFMDKLPLISECVHCITSYAPSYGTSKQKNAIHVFATQLEELWHKAFLREHVLTLKVIKKKLDTHLAKFRTQVQKKRGNFRNNMKLWRESCNTMFDLLKPSSDPNKFDNDEKVFYFDQKQLRRFALSDQIDSEYEAAQSSVTSESDPQLMDIDDPNEDLLLLEGVLEGDEWNPTSASSANSSFTDTTIYQGKNRSGFVRDTSLKVSIGTQTEMTVPLNMSIRKIRNFDPKLKMAIAVCSSKAGLTIGQSRKAFQVVSEMFYDQKYYLDVKDVPNYYCQVTSKKPRMSSEYELYKNVLPSPRVLERTRHLLAIEAERNCSLAILDTDPGDNITVHYDTTTRRRIRGEWTSLIVKLQGGVTFRMRPLSLAIENRENIASLLVEQLSRLAVAGNTTSTRLWEAVTALMTDSVAKNLHIEEVVAATLSTNHIPLHLLGVSHTCEVFDKGNLMCIQKCEKILGLRDFILARMPFLKSFLSQNKSVVIVAIQALTKLVVNDGHKSSLWELFEKEVTTAGKKRKHSQYKERRFGLLGYTAACIIYHLEEYQNLLHNTVHHNQLVQACEVYINCDFILSSLRVLAWFTYKVTMPFLNMVEKCSQEELLKLLPQLHKDLISNSLETLNEYHVDYSFTPPKPESRLEKILLDKFCKQASHDLAVQRGREYGFSITISEGNTRATKVDEVSPSQLRGLPTNNLDCERDLAKFDKLAARSAACSNRKFTGKGIRDDMTLFKSNNTCNVTKTTQNICKLLDEREKTWVDNQKKVTEKNLEKKMANAQKATESNNILLNKCKSWSGPFTDIDELEECVMRTTDEKKLKQILRTELCFRRHLSPHDLNARPHLYKVNQITTTDMKINLAIILTNEDGPTSEIPDMPDEDEIIRILRDDGNDQGPGQAEGSYVYCSAKMELVNSKSAILSNYEVYSLLEGIARKSKKLGKKATVSQKHLMNVVYDTLKYLENTPCRSQSPDMIQSFLTVLPEKDFKLTKAEKLQLINLRPTTPVEMQLVIEDSEERLSEERIDELIALVQEYLPLGSNGACPNGT